MSARTSVTLLVLLAAGLAGCSGFDPSQTGSSGQTPPPASPPWQTLSSHGTSVATFRSNPTAFDASFPRIFFNVTPDVTALLVELVWDDPVQDLDAFAHGNADSCPYGPVESTVCTVTYGLDFEDFAEVRNREGGPGMPDSPSRVLVTREDIQRLLDLCGDPCLFGSYPTTHQTEPAVANVEWWNYVTLFRGPVPDGFTAVPA